MHQAPATAEAAGATTTRPARVRALVARALDAVTWYAELRARAALRGTYEPPGSEQARAAGLGAEGIVRDACGATFAAGTVLQVEVRSGTVANSSLAFTPTIRVAGDFANGWTLTFDDGFGGPGEPDFNDLVILVRAAP
jgi:hypothetical protein